MEDLFTLKGTFTHPSGHLPELLLAIVDEDAMDEDDLLGLGIVGPEGAFSVSFLGSEFRQDAFEMEETPDIKIVVSLKMDGAFKPVFVQVFDELDWSSRQADLGQIDLGRVNFQAPEPLADEEALPGVNKRAKRLDIDDAMVRECVTEVAPIVEHLTGWRGLLDGLKIEVADSLAPYMMRETLRAQGKEPSSAEARITAALADLVQAPGAGCALYDPHIHTLVVNRSIMEQAGLDALKIMCGHELVHVGQFKNTPGLTAHNLHHLQAMGTTMINASQEEFATVGAYMIELEGYAKYIESDFLHKKFYSMATLMYHASVFEQLVQALLTSLSEGVSADQNAKANQYSEGLERYRKRQVGEIPARFELDVASLPRAPPA